LYCSNRGREKFIWLMVYSGFYELVWAEIYSLNAIKH
jgi:hypothetical protein